MEAPIQFLFNDANYLVAADSVADDDNCVHLQVRLVCLAEALPNQLFTRGEMTLREEDSNRMLMDDLGLKAAVRKSCISCSVYVVVFPDSLSFE